MKHPLINGCQFTVLWLDENGETLDQEQANTKQDAFNMAVRVINKAKEKHNEILTACIIDNMNRNKPFNVS